MAKELRSYASQHQALPFRPTNQPVGRCAGGLPLDYASGLQDPTEGYREKR